MTFIVIFLLWLAVGYTYGKFFDSEVTQVDSDMTDLGVFGRLVLYFPILLLTFFAVLLGALFLKFTGNDKP
jgi:hypothetical protein